MNWKDIPNEREKYAAYLCSREWSELKTKVHKRSCGRCERVDRLNVDRGRCPLPGNAVHHLTYARKYKEDADDLIHYCNACHDFTHDKSDFDPLRHITWCRYVFACLKFSRTPVDSAVAFFGFGDTEAVVELCAENPKTYAMLLLHQKVLDIGLQDYIGRDEDGNGIYESRLIIEGVIEDIQNMINLPFDLSGWLRFGTPRILFSLYDESIKQIAKCIGHEIHKTQLA